MFREEIGTIHCPRCGQEVSEFAQQCTNPACGQPLMEEARNLRPNAYSPRRAGVFSYSVKVIFFGTLTIIIFLLLWYGVIAHH